LGKHHCGAAVGETSFIVTDGVAQIVWFPRIKVTEEAFEGGSDDVGIVVEEKIPLFREKSLIDVLQRRYKLEEH